MASRMAAVSCGVRAVLLVAACATATQLVAPKHHHVLFVVADNMRPSLGAYGVSVVQSPRIDRFAKQGTLFSRAYCQLAWCSPSRSSFLSGRRPNVTQAWNFVDSFRNTTAGQRMVTLPGMFKQAGYYTVSAGKVFHPHLPPNFDYPESWSELPTCVEKPACPNHTMTCEFEDTPKAADIVTADKAISLLHNWHQNQSSRPFFLAVGFQSTRLPWSYPASAGKLYPSADHIPGPKWPHAPNDDEYEWFRPTEVNFYSDIHNISHNTPLGDSLRRSVRRAYYAAISHIDTQFGRVLDTLSALGLDNSTVVVFFADHGQSLGEHDMWSMMSLMETSLRVPLIVRLPGSQRGVAEYPHVVELVDLMTTVPVLAGLAPPPAAWNLPGADLSRVLASGAPARAMPRAIGQITRCHNCSRSYNGTGHATQCQWDQARDARYTVPCCMTPRHRFDVMGTSVRTNDWRYTIYCAWNGNNLTIDWSNCPEEELFDHRADTEKYDVDSYENENIADDPRFASVKAQLKALVEQR